MVVYKTRNGLWRARLASGALPKLSINNDYAQLIKTTGGEPSNLSQKLQEARWMLKNIQQRSDTILRVSQAIVEAQQAFFEDATRALSARLQVLLMMKNEVVTTTVQDVIWPCFRRRESLTAERVGPVFGNHSAKRSRRK